MEEEKKLKKRGKEETRPQPIDPAHQASPLAARPNLPF
jgi:hypothetical protein